MKNKITCEQAEELISEIIDAEVDIKVLRNDERICMYHMRKNELAQLLFYYKQIKKIFESYIS